MCRVGEEDDAIERASSLTHSLTYAFIARGGDNDVIFLARRLFVTNHSVAVVVAAAVSSADRGVGCSALPSRLPALPAVLQPGYLPVESAPVRPRAHAISHSFEFLN